MVNYIPDNKFDGEISPFQVLVLQRAARLRLPRLERAFWATARASGAVPDRLALGPEVPGRSGEFGCDSYDI